MKLTDTECRKATPKEKRYRLSDENGLSLLVTPAGQKYWNVRYTVHGERKSESLGLYPDMSLKKARELALELKYKHSKSVLYEDIKPFLKRWLRTGLRIKEKLGHLSILVMCELL